MFVAVRGWIEVDHTQRPLVERVIEAHRHELYSGGWAFPAAPFNWQLYLFYGGDLRESSVGWLREQVAAIAALAPVDDDGDMPAGFFLLDDERHRSVVWTIRNGRLDEVPASPELGWFAQRQ